MDINRLVHKELKVSATGGLIIEKTGTREETAENEKITITKGRFRISEWKNQSNSKRWGRDGCQKHQERIWKPSYAGILDLYATSEGIVIINELPVESYLGKVVPSEMPASYQKEALKAQAVCARNYAERQMEDYAYPEYQAHVNDSTDYQVYNSAQQDTSTEAVRETAIRGVKI